MIKCVLCQQEVTSRRGLAFHLKKHGIDSVDKYIELYPEQMNEIEPKDESLLTCPICGRYNMKQLGQHIVGTHKMTHEQFLALYPNQKMFIDAISERCSRATKIGHEQFMKNKQADPEKYREIRRKAVETRKRLHPDIGEKVAKRLRESGFYDRLSAKYKEMWQDDEYRQAQSDKAKKQHENGLTKLVLHNSKRYKQIPVTFDGVEYIMKSSWEVKFAEFLHSKGIPFRYETDAIPYFFNGKDRSYYPDFTIPNTNIIFEVKPQYQIDYAMNQAKRQACVDNGYDFRYITEYELENTDNINLSGCLGT